MKTQIIKIIPCILAGFILSACVGAVNVPSSVAEKKTESDPVVEKDTIVIVDDKEPEPEPEPKPQPEPEPKPELEAEPEPIVIDPEIALINICIMDDNGGDASCEPTVANHPCIRDPFGGVCHIQFANYYETAQANRIAFCIIEKNANKPLCNGANIAMNNCIEDPFADECKTQTGFTDYYQTAIGNRIAHCQDTYEPRPSYYSTPAICENACNINGDPFGEMCSDSNNESIRTQKYTFCEMAINANDASCVGAFSRPNVLTFLRSFSTPLSTTPNAENPESEFLQGTETGLNAGDFTIRNGAVKTLHLTDFSSDKNGVAFFAYGDTYYAGILSGTDLGAPVTEKTGTARWNGFFRTVGLYLLYRRDFKVDTSINTSVYENFALTVNFGAGDQAGTISGSVSFSGTNSQQKDGTYSLNGSFNDNGVITGNVIRTTRSISYGTITNLESNATLRGLIGQKGAVGVFISDKQGNSGYAGGFVARPPAE